MADVVGTHIRVECPRSCGAKIPLPVTSGHTVGNELTLLLDTSPLAEHLQNHGVPE